MPVLKLRSLHCHRTEDRRYDDCRLDIKPDVGVPISLRRNMSRRQTWQLDRDVVFERSVALQLWDEDRRRDDNLGQTEITTRRGLGSFTFNLDDAHYDLSYEVLADDRTPTQIAWEAITRSRHAGVWRNIPRATFVNQLRTRMRNPAQIDQASAPLCGPTVMVYELARTNMPRYLQLARELFETGNMGLIGHTIEVPDGLLEDRIGGGMDEVDWMFAASLRNDANAVLRVRSHLLGGLRGASLSGAMKDWSRQVLGMPNVHDISTETGGELAAMGQASRVVSDGGHAFMQVEAGPLLSGGSDRRHYDHWLPLIRPATVSRNRVVFDTYTWGATRTIDVSAQTFCSSFHGVVTAHR